LLRYDAGHAMTLVALLAAGRAERFGGGKLDAMLGARAVGAWALAAARGLGAPVVVIAGETPLGFAAGADICVNTRASLGMGGSIALAAAQAKARGAARLLVMLADMPLVSVELLQALVAATPPSGAAACAYEDGAHGPPACFDAALFDRLIAMPPERGANAVLKGVADLALVQPRPGQLADVDRREDLARIGRDHFGQDR
jgi:molybdenum cofactor cytidylyltransferase